jgi:hypothetical protein
MNPILCKNIIIRRIADLSLTQVFLLSRFFFCRKTTEKRETKWIQIIVGQRMLYGGLESWIGQISVDNTHIRTSSWKQTRLIETISIHYFVLIKTMEEHFVSLWQWVYGVSKYCILWAEAQQIVPFEDIVYICGQQIRNEDFNEDFDYHSKERKRRIHGFET